MSRPGVVNKALKFAQDNLDTVKDIYINGSRQDLADFLGLKYSTTTHVVIKLGLYEKWGDLRRERIRREPLSRNPFTNIDEKSAYLLGYIMGDGCLRRPNMQGAKCNLNIYSNDDVLLRKLMRLFVDEDTIRTRSYGPGKKVGYYFDINDMSVGESLLSLGVKHSKSYEGVDLPDLGEHQRHLVRGLLDSDGCVTYSNGRNQLRVSFYGLPSLIQDLMKYIPMEGTYYLRKDGLAIFSLYTQSEIKKFYEWLYEGATLFSDFKKGRMDVYFGRK